MDRTYETIWLAQVSCSCRTVDQQIQPTPNNLSSTIVWVGDSDTRHINRVTKAYLFRDGESRAHAPVTVLNVPLSRTDEFADPQCFLNRDILDTRDESYCFGRRDAQKKIKSPWASSCTFFSDITWACTPFRRPRSILRYLAFLCFLSLEPRCLFFLCHHRFQSPRGD